MSVRMTPTRDDERLLATLRDDRDALPWTLVHAYIADRANEPVAERRIKWIRAKALIAKVYPEHISPAVEEAMCPEVVA